MKLPWFLYCWLNNVCRRHAYPRSTDGEGLLTFRGPVCLSCVREKEDAAAKYRSRVRMRCEEEHLRRGIVDEPSPALHPVDEWKARTLASVGREDANK